MIATPACKNVGQQQKTEVFVKRLDGNRLMLELDNLDARVEDINAEIERREMVLPGRQRLVFQGKELKRGSKLSEHNVGAGATLYLVVTAPLLPMDVCVSTAAKQGKFYVELHPEASIASVLETICSAMEVPCTQEMQVEFGGRHLDSQFALCDYGVTAGANLTLRMAPGTDATNLNAATASELSKVLSQKMADRVLCEQRLNGEFECWETLRSRVRGLGVTKVAKLKAGCFVVEPRPGFPRNLNTLPSALLETILTKYMATKVVKEQGLHGDYETWETLQDRIAWLGVKKVERLKSAGLILRPRVGAAITSC